MSLKQLAMLVAILGGIVGGAWALDSRIDAKITKATASIQEDVRAIRNLLETSIIQLMKGP